MKLTDLIKIVARVLDEPERSVNVRAIALRNAGLIRSTGRGLNAANMSQKDAANLLMACMVGGKATECDKVVAQVGDAALRVDEAPARLLGLDEVPRKLGEALAALLSVLAEAGSPRDLEPIPNITIERDVSRWFAEIRFIGGPTERIIGYEAKTAKYRQLMAKGRSKAWAREIEKILSGAASGYRSVGEKVQHQGLWVVARAVADRPYVAPKMGVEPK